MQRKIFIVFIVPFITCFFLTCGNTTSKYNTLTFAHEENEKKVKKLREIIKNNPNDVESHMELAKILLSEEMIEKAIAEYEAVINNNPNHIEAYLLLYSAVQRLPKPELGKALIMLEKASRIAPDNDSIHLNLGQLYIQLNASEKAEVEFHKVIELSTDPEHLLSAHLGLMSIYEKQGIHEKANAEYELAKQIFPDIDKLIKQFEIYHTQSEIRRITPAPNAEKLFVDDGIHPSDKERIMRLQEEIRKLPESER